MAVQPQTAKAERRGWAPSNSEILGPEVLELPPTMDDIGYDTPRGLRTLDEILDHVLAPVVPLAWDTAKLLSGLRFLHQLDDRLPPSSPQDCGVYLVTAPRGSTRYRFTHWSLYSQGHFYHLTAAGSDALHYMEAKSGKPSSSQLNRQVPVALKVQNVVNPDGVDFVPPTEKTKQIALQAYHIGSTRFDPEQIRRLATSLISEIRSYNIFSENCQLFAISMANRTVMTRRNCSVFVGDIHQIAKWDSAGGPGRQNYYSSATGYLLAGARGEDDTARLSMAEMIEMSWRGLRLNRRAQAIAILYRDGKQALGAYDPSGKREGLRYVVYRFRQNWPTTKAGEIREDLKHGRWRDALFGRFEWRKSSYIRKESKARSGHNLTKLLLPVYRWTIQVTKEEHLAWAAEAAAASTTGRQEV